MFSNELALLRAAALAGLGIALLPRMFTERHITNKELVPILPSVGTSTQMALVYQEREFIPPHVRAFMDHVIRWAEREMPAMRP